MKAPNSAGGTLEVQADGFLRQPGRPPLPGDLAAGDCADDAVNVADRQFPYNALAALDGGLAELEQRRDIQGGVQSVVLRNLTIPSHFGPTSGA